MENNLEENFIRFNFDISAYRLLGRELITDRITALFEIVKNSYDANSTNVTLSFIKEQKSSNISKIIIQDNGIGMDFMDIENRWMIIGTSSKRRNRVSPPPCERKVAGKKGIGRFAVDLLGSKLTLKSKKKESENRICLITDWSYYSKLENSQLELPFEKKKEYFTDIKNKYWYESADKSDHGTILEIDNINDIWTEYDISRIRKELSKLVSPFLSPKCPFNIKIHSPFDGLDNVNVKPLSISNYATKSIILGYNKETDTQEIIRHEKGDLVKISVPKHSFGLVNFRLYYFNQSSKKKFKKEFDSEIDGIKIYRDGIITTPFAEHEADQNKQKDILGIDKRRYSAFFEKINSRDILGYVDITDERNPKIIETTNRQDFTENKEYRDLKLFIIEQLEQLEKLFKFERNLAKEKTTSNLVNANYDLKNIKKVLSNIKQTSPQEVKTQIIEVEKGINKLQGTLNKNLKDYNKLEEEIKQKEDLFFSLVSLQTYAAMFSHMTKHTIGHVIRDAEYFSNYFPNEKLNSRFNKISKRIYSEFLTLRKGVDFMLKYAKSDSEVEDIDFKSLVIEQFSLYSNIFKKQNISTDIIFNESLYLRYNKKVLQDVFDNLISNSIKALKTVKNKLIKCSGSVDDKELTIYFSDNGIGISEEDKYRVFDIFFTKTAEEGGAGIGLFMVKTRIEAMNGTIEVVESEFKPTGATFKITLPFKK